MHYGTFAENVDEALKIAKAYARNLAKDPEEDHEERDVLNIYYDNTVDLVTEETLVKETKRE